MKSVSIPFGQRSLALQLPDDIDILQMGEAEPLGDPAGAIADALANPTESKPLVQIASAAVGHNPEATAVIVVSDHTRPVPYKGDDGILWPVISALRGSGVRESNITIMVATGTHHLLNTEQLKSILDPRVFESAVNVVNHDSRDASGLRDIGETPRGTRAQVNARYLDADIKVLTGLVETHFIAGYSGGRKAICPGLVGEQTTFVFHGPEIMADPETRDLNLDANPLHQEAMAVAEMAGWDFLINVTLNTDFAITGVFAGDLDLAHRAACRHLQTYVAIRPEHPYDLVLTHGAFVGINHYQAVKPGLAAMAALAKEASLLIIANHTDTQRIGSPRYRTLLHLMTMIGPDAFRRLLFSADWQFLPDQWEVQAWADLMDRVRDDGLYYYAPQLSETEYQFLPGTDGNTLLPEPDRYRDGSQNVQTLMDAVIVRERKRRGDSIRIAFMLDGPYGIVLP